MIANYHTHTPRCNHAEGTGRDYAQRATEAGLQILGFSDHSPYCFPHGYHSHFRMELAQLDGYCGEILALRPEFPQLEIHLGLELEYYPRFFPELLAILRDHPLEYLILGQHFIHNEVDGPYCGLSGGDDLLRQYCRQSRDAFQTGLFTYFAHPDLVHYQGDPSTYRREMRGLCQEAKACAIPLEINLLGLSTGRHYPNPLFWEVAGEVGCTAILGRDAHDPQMLLDTQTADLGRELARHYGLELVDTVALRPIG